MAVRQANANFSLEYPCSKMFKVNVRVKSGVRVWVRVRVELALRFWSVAGCGC